MEFKVVLNGARGTSGILLTHGKLVSTTWHAEK